jgi:hypothetical protein
MPVSCQADPHTDADAANDPALMVVCRVGLDILGPFPRAVGGFGIYTLPSTSSQSGRKQPL